MSSINEVIDALSATITAATGWRCTTNWDNPPVPCVVLYPDDIGDGDTYYESFGGGMIRLPVVANVLVSSVNNAGQTRVLYDAIGPFGATSIPRAILENTTLGTDPDEATGGAAARMSASVTAVNEIGPTHLFDGTRVVQAKVRIKVLTRGDR